VLDDQGALQDQATLIKLGTLAGLFLAGRALHERQAEAAFSRVNASGVFLYQLGFIPGSLDQRRSRPAGFRSRRRGWGDEVAALASGGVGYFDAAAYAVISVADGLGSVVGYPNYLVVAVVFEYPVDTVAVDAGYPATGVIAEGVGLRAVRYASQAEAGGVGVAFVTAGEAVLGGAVSVEVIVVVDRVEQVILGVVVGLYDSGPCTPYPMTAIVSSFSARRALDMGNSRRVTTRSFTPPKSMIAIC
jgi:hypothetical protein